MIFGNITQEKTYAFLPEDLKECFAYAKEHDLVSYEKGSHPIDGEDGASVLRSGQVCLLRQVSGRKMSEQEAGQDEKKV